MELEVWLEQTLVAHLEHDAQAHRFGLSYSPEWLRHPRRYPLSPHLPLERPTGQTDEAHSAEVRQFFENLLPEGEALDHAAQANGVSKANLMGLLIALGRETAGALRITLPGSQPPPLAQRRRLLTPEELSERIRTRDRQPFSLWDGTVRLSIAGLQDKIAVYEEGGRWYLVDDPTLASTFIVKPAPARPRFADLPYNEFFCMRLAARCGVEAAEVQLHHVPEPVLFVRRFDREATADGVRRLHVIDGCQALGLPVQMKYERNYGDSPEVRGIRDGASLPRLFRLLQHSPRPIVDRRKLLRWAIFQVLIRNTDAHGKNLSFYAGVEGLRLAPAYDLVCMPPLGLDHPMAMAIGDAFEEREITPFEWASFASGCGVQPRMLSQELVQLCARVLDELPALARECAGIMPPHVSEAIGQAVAPVAQRHMAIAREAAQVKRSYL